MTDGLPMPQRVLAITAMLLGTAVIVLDGAVPTVALPTIARDLHIAGSSSVAVVAIYQLVLVMFLLPFSTLGDRLGHRRLYCLGLVLFIATSALCLVARSLPVLLLLRASQGFGAAAALSVSQALTRSIYPAAMLGRGMGINAVVVSVAAAAAPSLGGLVLGAVDWPFVFTCPVPFAVLSLALARFLPRPRVIREHFDIMGAGLCAATLGLLVAGLEAIVNGYAGLAVAALPAGAATAVALTRRERLESRPILPVDLLGRRLFALSALSSFTAFIATMSVLVSLPFRFEHSFGLSPREVGTLVAFWPFATMIVAPVASALSDRYPAGILGAIGMGIAVTGLILLAYLPGAPNYGDLAWRLALCGAGFGLFFAPNARLIISAAPYDRAAAAGGLISTIRLTGQTLGTTLVAALLSWGYGGGSAPALLAAALGTVAGLCSLGRVLPRSVVVL
jgi:DHA2 family multidrug resistance protein-like MFS transporter